MNSQGRGAGGGGSRRSAQPGPAPAITTSMYGMLMAVLILTATVNPGVATQDPFTPPPGDPFSPAPIDQRLVEPLRLLSEVKDRDGQPIGAPYADLVQALHLTLAVADLRPGLAGKYTIPTRTVTISEASMREDPKFVAAALAHEIKHGDDADFVGLGLLEPDCLTLEARG